ncbi:MAG: polysaccharide deacetylase [Burkholderiales bacterium]|nr:polysaccharide deacetylase [Burkholderiales bacterium]
MRAPLTVYLTFDVEVWCNGWSDLDAKFPASFERYVYGRSKDGDYALPKTLEILGRNALRGVFFVEPLFAARFGQRYLDIIVGMIHGQGQEVQLHLHPEWTDEIRPALIADVSKKRQHLSYYTREEQAALIGHGVAMLGKSGCSRIDAFRAGSFAANRATYEALAQVGLKHDSSFDVCLPISSADLDERAALLRPFVREGVRVHPMSVFRDGFGRLRHAQVGACSFMELRQGLEAAYAAGLGEYVVLSHNFEMLEPGSCVPDRVVMNRFSKLCAFLARERGRFRTAGFADEDGEDAITAGSPIPKVSAWATGVRYLEQAWRRL